MKNYKYVRDWRISEPYPEISLTIQPQDSRLVREAKQIVGMLLVVDKPKYADMLFAMVDDLTVQRFVTPYATAVDPSDAHNALSVLTSGLGKAILSSGYGRFYDTEERFEEIVAITRDLMCIEYLRRSGCFEYLRYGPDPIHDGVQMLGPLQRQLVNSLAELNAKDAGVPQLPLNIAFMARAWEPFVHESRIIEDLNLQWCADYIQLATHIALGRSNVLVPFRYGSASDMFIAFEVIYNADLHGDVEFNRAAGEILFYRSGGRISHHPDKFQHVG